MEIRLLDSADEDLKQGYHFYEAQAAGLGDYFLDCVQADLRSLVLYAGIHAKVAGFHCMLMKRFPFAAYYVVVGGRVDVYSILDCRRDPVLLAARLRSARRGR